MSERFLVKLLNAPTPLQSALKILIKKMSLGSYSFRVAIGATHRPYYSYCVLQAAKYAKKLGINKISVIEFGVAGGNSLLQLEKDAIEASKLFSIEIEVYGFDTAEGLPAPEDYRDLPYHWKEGFFSMDFEALSKKLKLAKLVIGNVSKTIDSFHKDYKPAPIGAVSFDLDYYSSTVAALKIFNGNEKYHLPRVFCYFDDVIGNEIELYNDYTGELLAIKNFNDSHEDKKIVPVRHLLCKKVVPVWHHSIYAFHHFTHSMYNQFISDEDQQLHLD